MKLTNLQTRRAIRSFSDAKLTNEQVENILTAAQYAPTSMGSQPYKLVVVRKGDIPADKLQALTWGQTQVIEADMVVYIYSVKRNEVDPAWMESKLSYVPAEVRKERVQMSLNHFATRYDVPGAAHAVALAMALEADANGVGSVIFSGFNKEGMEELFKDIVPTNYELTVGVSFGIKSDKAVVYPRQEKPLSDFVINYKK